jgi:hypothetical protein
MSFGWSDLPAHRAGDHLLIVGKENHPDRFQGKAAGGLIIVAAPSPPDHDAAEAA